MPSIALIVIGESKKIRSYPSFNYKNQNSLSTDNNEDNYDELSELRNNLKPDEIILMQKDDEFYIKMNKEEWEKAKAKGADEDFEEL